MISEGGGQGLATMACLQDLSQARSRWPEHADGFPSLFGTTVVLPGIGDVRTLEALSVLAGDEEILTRTVSSGRTLTDRPLTDLITGGRPQHGESVSTQWRRRLPVDVHLPRRHRPRRGLRRAQSGGLDPPGSLLCTSSRGAPSAPTARASPGSATGPGTSDRPTGPDLVR